MARTLDFADGFTSASAPSGTPITVSIGDTVVSANQGSVFHAGASGVLAQTAVGTSGQALVSAGTGTPTWFAPTNGSVLFAGASGVLAQDNSKLFWENSNKRLLIGNNSSKGSYNEPLETFVSNTYGGAALFSYSTGAAGLAAVLSLNRSRNNTIGTQGLVSDGDTLGCVMFRGSDGVIFRDGAYISAVVEGTPGSDDLPTRLSFATSPDGTATPTERMRITREGRFYLYALGNNTETATLTYNSSTGVVNYSTSSARYKKDIVNLESVVDTSKIYDLRPVHYAEKSSGNKMTGLIAEEVESVIPEFVSYAWVDSNGKTTMLSEEQRKQVEEGIAPEGLSLAPENVKYNSVFVAMLAEMKKLKAEIDQLKQQPS